MRIGIVGAGLIGRERLDAIKKLAARGHAIEISGVFDANEELTQKAAVDYGTKAFSSLDALLAEDHELTVIALPHDISVPIALEALKRRGDVLIEKPMGRDMAEANRLVVAGGDRLKIGFNYRFYPGIRQAIKDAKEGKFGEIITVDFVLGHGGSPGQEKTWKLNEERAGGGCLIDPGIHLLDLCTLLAPEGLKVEGGSSWSGLWKTGIEEDVKIILKNDHFSISLHISIVMWRSVFRMAINGTEGYGIVSGRNRSYGPQTYITGPRWGWQKAKSQAASENIVLESDGLDVFADEMEALCFPGDGPTAWPPPASGPDALQVMQLLDDIRMKLALRREYTQPLAPR